MGRGRDLIYFARRGFRVLGIDIEPEGIAKARRRAARYGIPLPTRRGDLRTLRLRGKYHVVFSSGFLNYLPTTALAGRIAHFQAATRPGGIHAVNAFISRPSRKPVPDLDPKMVMLKPGELRAHYRGWTMIESRELDLRCTFGGASHRHAVDVVVARKPEGSR
jgi:tellurite methyltransferase